jgi:hypothetical protein
MTRELGVAVAGGWEGTRDRVSFRRKIERNSGWNLKIVQWLCAQAKGMYDCHYSQFSRRLADT